jgi:predicted ATPase
MTYRSHTPGDQLFVISGCSGSGKSALIAALAEHGEATVPEPGRQIVREYNRLGGERLPWDNLQRFLDLCAEQAVRDFDQHAMQGQRTFFDRSLVDVAAAVDLWKLAPPPELKHAVAAKRYAPVVFMSPPWEALFHPDAERRHTFADAVREYENLVPTYRRFGYELRFLPQRPVADRVAFVLSVVEERSSDEA